MILSFQNCGVGFEADSSLASRKKDLIISQEWERRRASFIDYARNAPRPESLNPLYDVQLSSAPFLQYAVETKNNAWLMDLADLYSIGLSHLVTNSSYLFYYPARFSGGSYTTAYLDEIPLERSYKMWAEAPPAGSSFSVGVEGVLVSSQFLYPISVLIWDFAKRNKLNEPKAGEFAQNYWDVLVKDHLLRWIFNEGTLNQPNSSATINGMQNIAGFGAFQLRGWGCDDGDFSHAERVEHLTHRRFGKNYFQPLYGTTFSAPQYCNSVHDTDLWILANVAQALIAHLENPKKLPMSTTDYLRLRQHLQNGLILFESRMTYRTAPDFKGKSVEVGVFDEGGFEGHPDFDYASDRSPTFPGYSVAGAPANRSPLPGVNVSWDVSHARRLVQFLWTMEKAVKPLNLQFSLKRIQGALARQMAFKIFNRDLAAPSFANFMNGDDGWFRVNYGSRPAFGYPPSSWDLGGRSFLTGGFGFWQKDEAALESVLLSAVKKETFPNPWTRIEVYPSLPASYFNDLQSE